MDANDIERDAKLDYDVCIVGGGIAGIAIARELLGEDLDICVLESGAEEFDRRTQELYRGECRLVDAEGQARRFDDYMFQSRLRMLGGSGNAWGAKCGVLDPVDLEERESVPYSGWPISRADLDPYYDRACDTLQIRRFDYDPSTPFDEDRPPLRIGEGGSFETTTRHFSPIRRGGPGAALDEFKDGVRSSPRIDTILNANVTEIETAEREDVVSSVAVATLDGNRFTVTARWFVLATGGIENARLLLLSRRTHKAGIGNDADLVGRFFSGHYTAGLRSGIFLTNLDQSIDLYTGKDTSRTWGVFSLARAAQREHGLRNFTVTLNPLTELPSDEDTTTLESFFMMDGVRSRRGREAFPRRELFQAGHVASVYFMGEQEPNPDSRITLGEERDELDQPRLRLTWTFTEADFETLDRSIRWFGRELGRASAGRLKCELEGTSLLHELNFSRHHIGATRMATRRDEGVVDADAKVHGIENLYVAGSSVFPTPGIANPTLTIVALCHRLCDHLKERMRG